MLWALHQRYIPNKVLFQIDPQHVTAALEAMPANVATVAVDLPRIAVYTTWANTEKVGWVRLAFDRFDGVIELGQGFAHTREPITLEGPSARMKFSGRSDLRGDGPGIGVNLLAGQDFPRFGLARRVADQAGGAANQRASTSTRSVSKRGISRSGSARARRWSTS